MSRSPLFFTQGVLWILPCSYTGGEDSPYNDVVKSMALLLLMKIHPKTKPRKVLTALIMVHAVITVFKANPAFTSSLAPIQVKDVSVRNVLRGVRVQVV